MGVLRKKRYPSLGLWQFSPRPGQCHQIRRHRQPKSYSRTIYILPFFTLFYLSLFFINIILGRRKIRNKNQIWANSMEKNALSNEKSLQNPQQILWKNRTNPANFQKQALHNPRHHRNQRRKYPISFKFHSF